GDATLGILAGALREAVLRDQHDAAAPGALEGAREPGDAAADDEEVAFHRHGSSFACRSRWVKRRPVVCVPAPRSVSWRAMRPGVAESDFDRTAVSRKGALGLMQLMPQTAAFHRVRNVFLPRDNIEGGCRHLRMLLDRYGGNLPLVIAAYNAGTQRVEDAGGVPPIA